MTFYSNKNYCEYNQGQLPLIISISHGGNLCPYNIPDRIKKSSSLVKLNDINTQEIGREIFKLIKEKFKGRSSYMIVNHLHRSKLDVNRPLKEGAEISETINAWIDYHNYLNKAVEEIKKIYSNGLLIDIHGHGHSENKIELGYALSSNTLSLSTSTLNSDHMIHKKSSINALYKKKRLNLKFTDLLFGELSSFGSKLQSYGYNTIPSYIFKYPFKDENYFSGGYIVQKYSSGSNDNERVIDAIQIELPMSLRDIKQESNKNFILNLSETINWYIKMYYLNN